MCVTNSPKRVLSLAVAHHSISFAINSLCTVVLPLSCRCLATASPLSCIVIVFPFSYHFFNYRISYHTAKRKSLLVRPYSPIRMH